MKGSDEELGVKTLRKRFSMWKLLQQRIDPDLREEPSVVGNGKPCPVTVGISPGLWDAMPINSLKPEGFFIPLKQQCGK